MGSLVVREASRHLRQTAWNLIQNFSKKRVRLVDFRSRFDGAEKGIGGSVEAAQTVVSHAQRQLQLGAGRPCGDSFFENEYRFGEPAAIEQRTGGIEIKLDGMFP